MKVLSETLLGPCLMIGNCKSQETESGRLSLLFSCMDDYFSHRLDWPAGRGWLDKASYLYAFS